jgi:lipopolysaccharide transport protein LptA
LAKGNVSFEDNESEEITKAYGDEAEYDAVKDFVLLKGNASLFQGKDSLKGERIEYYIQTGKAKVTKVRGVVAPVKKK